MKTATHHSDLPYFRILAGALTAAITVLLMIGFSSCSRILTVEGHDYVRIAHKKYLKIEHNQQVYTPVWLKEKEKGYQFAKK